MSRTATVERTTAETAVRLRLDLDGAGAAEIDSGVGFLDHMLTLLAFHAGLDLTVSCRGDTRVDDHHSVEDVALCLGQALDEAAGARGGIARYGHCLLPMDETLVQVALDLSGRPAFVWRVPLPTAKVGTFDTELAEEFFKSVAMRGRLALHATLLHGRNSHHIVEAVFKGVGRSLRQALAADPLRGDRPASTKGSL